MCLISNSSPTQGIDLFQVQTHRLRKTGSEYQYSVEEYFPSDLFNNLWPRWYTSNSISISILLKSITPPNCPATCEKDNAHFQNSNIWPTSGRCPGKSPPLPIREDTVTKSYSIFAKILFQSMSRCHPPPDWGIRHSVRVHRLRAQQIEVVFSFVFNILCDYKCFTPTTYIFFLEPSFNSCHQHWQLDQTLRFTMLSWLLAGCNFFLLFWIELNLLSIVIDLVLS